MRIFWTVFLYLWLGTTAYSAEITIDPPHFQGKTNVIGILIEGEIQKGDYEKLHSMIKNTHGGRERIYLGSQGGDLLEALKIGRLIRKLNITTIAPLMLKSSKLSMPFLLVKAKKENLVCASSCFFILASGIMRSGGIIGIHRPYLSKDEYLSIGEKDAIKASVKLRKILEDYLIEMNMPSSFIERMYKISGSDMEWLDTDPGQPDHKYFSGPIPEVTDWVEARCPVNEADGKLQKFNQTKCFMEKIFESSCQAWFEEYAPNTPMQNRNCKWNFG